MNNKEARQWLDAAWAEALDKGICGSDPEIDRLAHSNVVSIRYALLTQILGKIADPTRNLLTLQLSATEDGAWDARSFSTSVVVPWVADNNSVLGTSAEPYASKPLRRPALHLGMEDVRNKPDWDALVILLSGLQGESTDKIIAMCQRILTSLVRRLAQQTFTYPIPTRVSLPQLIGILSEFLSESSGGLRPLAVSVALFKTLGAGFSLFSDVQSQGLNQADIATGVPGDIMCYDGDEIRLVIEIKDVNLTLSHVKSSTHKAKVSQATLSNLLFAVPGIRDQDEEEIQTLAQQNWASGLNIYTLNVLNLTYTSFTLLPEEWRVKFMRSICDELDNRQDQSSRKSWHDLLVAHS